MQDELMRYQRGEISFEVMALRTRKTWQALAKYLLGRWKAPSSVAPEDLEQELLLACWRCIPKWDPALTGKLERYVIFNCCDKAKKWLHKQRNAYRRDDKAPGRFPVNLASLGLEEHAEERLMGNVSTAPDQEERLARDRAIAGVRSDDLAFLHFQRAGSIELAAAAIRANPLVRLALRAPDLEAARAAVERSIERAYEAAVGAVA